MPRETFDEGVDYTITVNTPVDTSGETLTAVIFDRDDLSQSWQVGTAAGDSADTDIDILLDISDRAPDEYLLEIWVDIDNNNDARDLIVPDEGELYEMTIQNRGQITN